MTQGARELLMERLVLHKIVFFTLHSSRPMNPRYRRDDEHLLVRGFCGRTEEPVLQDIVKQLYDRVRMWIFHSKIHATQFWSTWQVDWKTMAT